MLYADYVSDLRTSRCSTISDLELAQGEFFALVGANGAGKTTCIRTILDFAAADAGQIELLGVPHRRSAARKNLAYLPERFVPPAFLSGIEFLRFVVEMHGSRFDVESARTLAEELELDLDALQRSVRTYSKGMAQKLGLAGSLLCDAHLLIFDEPMSGLDPKARQLVKRQLQKLRAQSRTLFFSTHLLADVAEICDSVGVLYAGKLRFCGPPDLLLDTFGGSSLEEAYLRCVDATAHCVSS